MSWIRNTLNLARGLRGRSVSTFLGITWGTLSIVLLLAFGESLRELMTQRARNLGDGIVIASPRSTSRSFAGFGRGRQLRVTEADVKALAEQIPEIGLISPEYVDYDRVRVGERMLFATISGVHASYGELRTMRPHEGGRFLNRIDVTESRRVVFLGDRVKQGLFGDLDAVGKTLVLRGIPFVVVGVLEPKDQDSDYQGEDRDRICMPSTTHALVLGRRSLDFFVWRAGSPDRHEFASRRVHEVLGRRLKFDPDDAQALWTWDTTEQQRMLFYAFLGFNLILGLSGLFTLLVGGIGVANLMFISVRQRTAEFGIQIALGARPRWILAQVMTQTALLVLAGGVCGFLLSAVCTAVARALPLDESVGNPVVSLPIALGTVALLAVIALLAGWFPARRAALLDPVMALNA